MPNNTNVLTSLELIRQAVGEAKAAGAADMEVASALAAETIRLVMQSDHTPEARQAWLTAAFGPFS